MMGPGQLDLPAVPLLLEASEAEVREECQQSSVSSGLCPVNTRHTETRDPAITPITLPLIITYINHKLGWPEYKEALYKTLSMVVVQQTSWSRDSVGVQVVMAPVSL